MSVQQQQRAVSGHTLCTRFLPPLRTCARTRESCPRSRATQHNMRSLFLTHSKSFSKCAALSKQKQEPARIHACRTGGGVQNRRPIGGKTSKPPLTPPLQAFGVPYSVPRAVSRLPHHAHHRMKQVMRFSVYVALSERGVCHPRLLCDDELSTSTHTETNDDDYDHVRQSPHHALITRVHTANTHTIGATISNATSGTGAPRT